MEPFHVSTSLSLLSAFVLDMTNCSKQTEAISETLALSHSRNLQKNKKTKKPLKPSSVWQGDLYPE